MRYLIILLGIIISFTANAIAVGGINVHSKYGQPLILEIELFNIYDINHKDIQVRIVPKSEHGIKTTAEDKLKNISFGIYTSNGIGWISITSPEKIYGGPVDFIIEVKWPEGRTFRHYRASLIGLSGHEPIEENICPSNSIWIKCLGSIK